MEELLMEERFLRFVEWIGDKIDRGDIIEFDLEMFYKYLPYIKNQEVLENCIDEENELGESLEWDMIEFVEGV
tara:strand:+ start:372 stop:590 length:219 start_codon:yes stop_codon:yes gene_type:complete